MEIAQLCKSTFNNQLQQSIYLCHKKKMSQIWQYILKRQDFKFMVTITRSMITPTTPTNVPTKFSTF